MPKPSQNANKQDAASRDPGPSPDRFEDLIEELESLVERIESGDIGLEESIDAYERGSRLVGKAREILTRAEQRVETIGADALGSRPEDTAE